MSLRIKLLLAQAPLAVALGLLGILAMVSTTSLGRYSSAILKDNYRSVIAAQRMQKCIERLQDAAVLPLLDGGTRVTAQDAERRQFESELQVEEGNITEPGEHDAAQQLRDAWLRYQQRFDLLLTMTGTPDARAFFFSELEPAFAAVKDAAENILAINQDAMLRKSDQAQHVADRLNTTVMLAAFAALLIGSGLSLLVTNRVLDPLESLTRTVQRIGEGDFEARLSVPGRDEIASLAATVNAMATRLSHYRRSSLGELLLAQRATQAAIDSLPDPVVVFDVGGILLSVNRAAETLLGITLEPTAGDPLEPVEAPLRAVLEQVRSHVLGGKGAYPTKGFDEAVHATTGDGPRYFLPRATPVYDEDGSIAGATVLLQDITRLRRVDDLRNDLVATVAHEFRTPLTSLRMAIHLCTEQVAGPLTDKQADLLYAARSDCERLQRMVEELLELSRMESGQIELAREPVAAAELVLAAVEAHRAVATDHGITLATAIVPDLDPVLGDRERLNLVLSNLIANAIRHGPRGSVVTIRALPLTGSVRFEVTDAGPGVAPEHQSTIFQKFVRLPHDARNSAGLGLSIAKEIVTAHGGEIGVISEPARGATFWFTLPVLALSGSDAQSN